MIESYMKEPILISACLLGVRCRYDSTDFYISVLPKVLAKYTIIAICPEFEIGLPIPRSPVEIVEGRAMSDKAEDLSNLFSIAANYALKLADQYNVKKALLKSGSPSCGPDFIYDGTFNDRLIEGEGYTACLLRQAGLSVFSENNCDRLFN